MTPHFASLLALLLLLPLCSQGATPRTRGACVLNSSGKQICEPSVLETVVRPRRRYSRRTRKQASKKDTKKNNKMPCKSRDAPCWCKMAMEYTNMERKKKGLTMLKLGPQSQMDNAMRYASKLSRMGYLVHQKLRDVTREVGCKHWVGGENLAFNYEQGNVARKCVDQWIGSREHYLNLVRDWFREVVIGFHFDDDGRIYCVQTFSVVYPRQTFGRLNGPKCKRVQVP